MEGGIFTDSDGNHHRVAPPALRTPRKILIELACRDDKEHLDLTPVEVPEAMLGPVSLEDRIREMIMQHLGVAAEVNEVPTFEEEDDFDWDDEDPDLVSGYEVELLGEDELEGDLGQVVDRTEESVEDSSIDARADAQDSSNLTATVRTDSDTDSGTPEKES